MMPNTVPSGRRIAIGRRGRRFAQRLDRSVVRRERRRASPLRDTTCDIDQCVAPPTSMYSMKRTSAPRAFANSSSGISSSSLTPRMTTVSILKPGNAIDGGVDAGEHARQLVEARQLDEAIALQRVEADRQAVQAGAP